MDVRGHASEPIGTDPRWGERTVNGLSVEVSGTNFWVSNVPLGAGTQEIVAAISDEAGNVGRTTNTVVVKIATNGAYQFDAAGNVTNIAYAELGTVGLAWDGWYMLKSVATNGATAESYTYDAYGRRVTITKGTNTLCLVYDGPHCIAEVDTNGVPVRSYTYGPGIDNVLAMTVHQPDVRTYYYIKDHLGSVLALTDESGALVESYSYDAWGRVLAVYDAAGTEISESAVGNRILWQGREYSWSTGLYYFRARWYDPVTGRWLSNDPIGISGGLNQYVFCGNNPVNFVDPFGCNPYGTPPPRWALPWRVYYAYYGGTHMVGYYSPTGQAGLGPQDIGPPGGPYPIDWMDHAFMFHDQDLACAPSHSGIRQAHSMLQIRLLVAPFRHPLPNHIQRPNLIRAWATIPVFFLAHPGSRLGHEFGNGHDDSGMVTFTFFELGF